MPFEEDLRKKDFLEGWRIVEETIDAIKAVSDGVHLMPLGDTHGLTKYLKTLLCST